MNTPNHHRNLVPNQPPLAPSKSLSSTPPEVPCQHLSAANSQPKFPGGLIHHVYRRYLSNKAFVARLAKPIPCGKSLFVPIPLSLTEFLSERETWHVIHNYALMCDDPSELVRLLKTITGFPGSDATFRRHLRTLAVERNDGLVFDLFQKSVKRPEQQN